MSGTGDPDYDDSGDVDIAPRKRQELVQWLSKPTPEQRPFDEDTWRCFCRTHFFHSLFAVYDLAQDGVWPIGRWREVFADLRRRGYGVALLVILSTAGADQTPCRVAGECSQPNAAVERCIRIDQSTPYIALKPPGDNQMTNTASRNSHQTPVPWLCGALEVGLIVDLHRKLTH